MNLVCFSENPKTWESMICQHNADWPSTTTGFHWTKVRPTTSKLPHFGNYIFYFSRMETVRSKILGSRVYRKCSLEIMVLTVERALLVNCIMRPAYCTVVELSRVERIGIPERNCYLLTLNESTKWIKN